MENMPRSLNFELPQAALQFGAYAQQLLQKSAANKVDITPTATVHDLAAATPTVASNHEVLASTANNILTSDFLQKLGATIFNSIQLQNVQKAESVLGGVSAKNMDMEYGPHQVVLDSSSFDGMDDLKKQLEYDKLMNEVWIGIVLTLILISMVFCICSCFLYHQFKTWKRNYQSTVMQSQTSDVESLKLPTDMEDPVPEYTLVSGLPSYEAALDLLQKTPKACLLVYPSVFGVFQQNEKASGESATAAANDAAQQQHVAEVTTPLLSATVAAATPATHSMHTSKPLLAATTSLVLPTYAEACHNHNNNNTSTLTAVSVTNFNVKSQKSALSTATTTTTTPTPTAFSNGGTVKSTDFTLAVKTDKC